MLVRYEVRGYTGNPNDKTETAAFQQLDSAISHLDRLKAAFGTANREQIAQFESALRNYRSSVDAFKATTQTAASVRKDLTTQGATIVKLGEELYGLQMQMGKEDTASGAQPADRLCGVGHAAGHSCRCGHHASDHSPIARYAGHRRTYCVRRPDPYRSGYPTR